MWRYILIFACLYLSGCSNDIIRADLSKPINVVINTSSKNQDTVKEYITASFNEWNLKAKNSIKWSFSNTTKCSQNTINISFESKLAFQQPNIIGLYYTERSSCPTIKILDTTNTSSLFVVVDRSLKKDRRYITLMHELGHYFGLPHSKNPHSIMNEGIETSTISPTCYDINELRKKFKFLPYCH